MAACQTELTWESLIGSNQWKGILQPLHLRLRELIIRCGDFCQAAHDAFNNDQNSKYCGSSRYGKASFFHEVMLQHASDYEVVSFLYATARVSVPEALLLHSQSRESWDRESNWIGFIAVTTDRASEALGRREVYVAWRGTARKYEWINALGPELESAKLLLPLVTSNLLDQNGTEERNDTSGDEGHEKAPKVMKGWLTIYTSDDPNSQFTKLSARSQLLAELKKLKEKYKDEKMSIILTGHSLGASLSVLSAFDLAENGFPDLPISAFVFGCPKVGNRTFKKRLEMHKNVNILHTRNKIDVIPLYPGIVLGYLDTGIELEIDTRKSPYLKDSKNPSDWHNLQAMLHIVAGWNGEHEEFKLRVKRSLALVNKTGEFLNDEYRIPGSWMVEKNKGMVVDENGDWVLAPPAEDDLPVPEY